LNPADLAGLLLALLLAIGAWLDAVRRRLPNWLCLATALAGLAGAALLHGAAAAFSGLGHAVLALLVGMVLFRFGLIGGGDAKFYAAAATWFTLPQAARLLLAVSLSGLALFLLWFTYRRLTGRKIVRAAATDADRFPYGIAISAGALLAWWTA